jgi:hypothetical protein
MECTMFHERMVTVGIVCLAAVLGASMTNAAAQRNDAAVTCSNPANGSSWQIAIDYGKRTVDAYPAEITAVEISWFDPKDGGHYTLDRNSGNFTAVIASSTGGYFRRGHCNLPKPR